jgi:signal transduction histidine kinase
LKYEEHCIIGAILGSATCIGAITFLLLRHKRNGKGINLLQQIQAEEKALQKLAAELHDNLAPALLLTRMQLEPLLELKEKKIVANCIERIEGLIAEIRQLGALSAGSVLGQKGFTEAIKDLLSTIEQYQNINSTLQIDQQTITLPAESERILFRIIQEAIQNILKHAKATEISIKLSEHKQHFDIAIRDNGTGFDPNFVKAGAGLRNMQERTQALNGKMTLLAAVGSGTLIHLQIPKQ